MRIAFHVRVLILLSSLLAINPVVAQSTRAPQQENLVEAVQPDAIRRLADQLRGLQDGELDPRMRDALKQLQSRNPQITPEELKLAEQFLRKNPGLQNPEYLNSLKRELENLKLPNGLPGFDPKNIPGLPPSIRPPDEGFPKLPPTQSKNSPAPHDVPDTPAPTGGRANGGFQLPKGMGDEGVFPPPEFGGGIFDPEQQTRRQRQLQQFRAMKGWWEQNVGPLEETPAVRKLMWEMFTNRTGSNADAGTLGDLFDAAGSGDGPELRQWLKDNGFDKWKLPSLGFGGGDKSMDFADKWSPPSVPSGNRPSLPRFGSAGDSWLPVILFGLIAAGALVLWWLWPKLTAERESGPRPLPGLGPWPLDPRAIADREALVRAFEYLSVLLCGQGVKTCNHVAIAAALEKAVPQAEALAEPLAKLYALARYTPADEPLPPTAIAAAREYLCELAGVPAV